MLGSWPLHSIFNFRKYIVIVGFTYWLDIYMYMHFSLLLTVPLVMRQRPEQTKQSV